MVKTDRQECRKEGFAGTGKAGARPGDVDDAGVQRAAVFTRVVIVVTRGSGGYTIPRGTLLHKG